MSDFQEWITPDNRAQFLECQQRLMGIFPVEENVSGAYCPVPLTGVPEKVKMVLSSRQDTLMQRVLGPRIKCYDPASAPFSPDRDKSSNIDKIYQTDAGKIAANRFFVGNVLYYSSGQGVESQAAVMLNRFSFLLFDRNVRPARMWPTCTVFLGYNNLEEEAEELSQVFSFMGNYNPGLGLRDEQAILLGFSRIGGNTIDVREAINRNFPKFNFVYDSSKEIPLSSLTNPQIYYEHAKK